MGGPRDEKPPVLTEANPKDQSLNTKPEEINLIFDEYVKLENPSKGIVITPRLDKNLIEFTALKNTVNIKLKQELEENTTYVFDFQKSVVDISEENPAENLKIVFSTGDAIDSISVSGNVNFYFPKNNQTNEDVLIGLYPVNDTTDLFTGLPYYLAQVDSSGNFKIDNIKNGEYFAYAWNDANGNLKADYKSEEWDFIPDTLSLNENLEKLKFNLALGDLTPIKITRTGEFGTNYDIILNRNSVKTEVKSQTENFEYSFFEGDKRIRIYPKVMPSDSIQFKVNLLDSVGNQIDTLIWAKFNPSERKPEELTVSANSGINFYQNLPIKLTFNKPVNNINTDSLFVQYDSASIIPIEPRMMSFEDSIQRKTLLINLTIPDSLAQNIFTLIASDSTFIDVEGIPNKEQIKANYRKLKRSDLADEIKGRIDLAEPPFIIQLIDSKNVVIRELFISEGQEYRFTLIEPGNFRIRVIEDRNGNQKWDTGNFFTRRNAERVFYYKGGEPETDQITIRAGWTLEEQNIKAGPKTGIIPEEN